MIDTSAWALDPEESELSAYYHAIGILACRWHEAEQEFYFLAAQQADILGTVGYALLTHVGSETICNSVRALARHSAPTEEVREALISTCSDFAIHRDNRNLFAHCRIKPSTTLSGEHLALVLKMTARSHLKQTIIEVRLADLRSMADEVLAFRLYLNALRDALQRISAGKRASLPQRPEQPRNRNQTLPQSLLDELLLP